MTVPRSVVTVVMVAAAILGAIAGWQLYGVLGGG
jgi:hypothetical protein